MPPAIANSTVLPPLSFPDRIRALRFFSGLNQSDLSKLLNCAQGTVSKLENGELEPTAFHLVRMREAFGVSIDAIVDGLIPYRAIAERFSNAALLPPRYARGASTKLKYLFPLVCAFEIRYGNAELRKELATLGLKPALFADSEVLVSGAAFTDLLAIYRARAETDGTDILAAVQNCVDRIRDGLTQVSSGEEDWSHPERWNLPADATPYASAVLNAFAKRNSRA